MDTSWIFIVVSVLASAFFSGIEMAFITSNKLKVELKFQRGSISARIISYFVKKPALFIAVMLVGNSIALVIYSVLMEKLLFDFLDEYISSAIGNLAITALVSTIIILVIAEYLPKSLFRINPNGILNFFAVPLLLIYWLLSPLVFVAIGLSNFILKRLAGVEVKETETTFGRIDLDHLVRETTSRQGTKEQVDHEVQIFRNALDFSEVKVRECMVPRTEIIAVDVESSVEELRKKFVETRLSKILIYEKNVDQLIGYIHSHELFRRPESIRSVLLPLHIFPESMPAKDALTMFIQQRKSLAVVVDEFGVTAGILTMEDVMEEIFGEIEDEHDKEELVDKQLSPTEFLFSGRIEIDTLNEKYKFGFEKDESYETLSGYIFHHYQSIPRTGEVIRIGNYSFTIVNVGQGRIDLVNVNADE